MADKKFVFVIGSIDDVESEEDLIKWYKLEKGGKETLFDADYFEFSLSEGSSCNGSNIRSVATFVGRGMAWDWGWSPEESISTLIDG